MHGHGPALLPPETADALARVVVQRSVRTEGDTAVGRVETDRLVIPTGGFIESVGPAVGGAVVIGGRPDPPVGIQSEAGEDPSRLHFGEEAKIGRVDERGITRDEPEIAVPIRRHPVDVEGRGHPGQIPEHRVDRQRAVLPVCTAQEGAVRRFERVPDGIAGKGGRREILPLSRRKIRLREHRAIRREGEYRASRVHIGSSCRDEDRAGFRIEHSAAAGRHGPAVWECQRCGGIAFPGCVDQRRVERAVDRRFVFSASGDPREEEKSQNQCKPKFSRMFHRKLPGFTIRVPCSPRCGSAYPRRRRRCSF